MFVGLEKSIIIGVKEFKILVFRILERTYIASDLESYTYCSGRIKDYWSNSPPIGPPLFVLTFFSNGFRNPEIIGLEILSGLKNPRFSKNPC